MKEPQILDRVQFEHAETDAIVISAIVFIVGMICAAVLIGIAVVVWKLYA